MGLIDVLAQSVEIDGLKFGQITLADWAEFTWYYKYALLREAEFATKEFPPEVRRQILKDTLDECKSKKLKYRNPDNPEEAIESDVSFEHPEVQAYVLTPAGLLYLFYLSLKHNQPQLTLEEVKKVATSEFVNKFYTIVLEEQNEAKDETQENPTGNP